ncbi:MAG TPA: lantibiotic dehydratase [Streptosporangiaceae bacterium]|nr:lantibiotic dehydratase [Streptosporangiaceae bacterium]
MDDHFAPRLGQWRVWPQFALRGAGFPAAGVLRLAPAGLAEAAAAFGAGTPLAGGRWQEFESHFHSAATESARELQRAAAMPMFRSAVAWQDRAVLERAIAPFLRWEARPGGRTSPTRQREEFVARYWQRFCVKNDTIGFFGPVGWGSWDHTAKGIVVEPGQGLTQSSEVYFASWAIGALARHLDTDPELREWVAPRRVPFVRVADGAVVIPSRPPQPADATDLRVLELCDGSRPARSIQAELGPGLDAHDALTRLAARRWIVWRLEVPAGAHPDRQLRSVLESIGDPAVRERALAPLAALERCRDRVRAALAGRYDADAIAGALAALESEFEELTAAPAHRAKGSRTAPGRGLVYSDSVRSARARAGAGLLDALAPIEPLLAAAAWLTSSLAERVMARIRLVYDQQVAEGSPLDLASFSFACMPVLHGAAASDADAVRREFWRRWQDILSPVPGARRVRISGAELAARVKEAFGAQAAGWTAARYSCPDVLISASEPDAVATGDVDLVLGELHLAANTLGVSLYVNQHTDATELRDLTDLDFPEPRLLPVLPKEHSARLSDRTTYALARSRDYALALADYVPNPAGPPAVLSADARVEYRAGQLVAVLPDGAVFGLADAFSHVLTHLARDMFQILPDSDHSPRVTAGRLVVAREKWRVPVGEMEFADEKNEARRFVRAGWWRAALDLPRFAFVISPAEPRPFYVDFRSPVYVNILAKAIRRLARHDQEAKLVISEMLPTPEQTWLTDDQAERYSSELRIVAVDTRPSMAEAIARKAR